MATQIFDDGSTLTIDDWTGAVSATDSPYINQSSAVYSPAGVSSGARTWDDVLINGFSRIIDAKVRPVRPENTAPVYTRTGFTLPGGGLDIGGMLPWLLIGGVALLVVAKFGK